MTALFVILTLEGVQSAESQSVPRGLVQQKKIRDCGILYGYKNDAGCFMEHLTTGEMIRPCKGALYDPYTCACTNPLPYNHQYNPDCQKAQQYGAFILYPRSGSMRNTSDTQTFSSRHAGQQPHLAHNAGFACENNLHYQNLLQLQHNGMHCTTADEVIEDLYQITLLDHYYRSSCTTTLITTLNTTSKTSDVCSCDLFHGYFPWPWPSLDHGTGRSCLSHHQSYYTLLSKYYMDYNANHGHVYPYTQRRHCLKLSDALSLLADIKDQDCVSSAIGVLRDTFHNVPSTNTCHCRSISTAYNCNKTETVRSLSTHNPIDTGSHTHLCPDRLHFKSEAVPMTLCGTPESSKWTKGQNVLNHCNNLPKFIAVASFIRDVYPGDGKAGVLISCNATAITIVTQQCDGGLKLEHIKKGSSLHFTDMPEIFFTINMPTVSHSIFG